jgi:hypothetical protein
MVNLSDKMESNKSYSIEDYIRKTSETKNTIAGAQLNLCNYAKDVLEEKEYHLTELHKPDIKTDRKLSYFDCINAPCVDT